MPIPAIAPLIPVAGKLLLELIAAARAAKEIDEQKYDAVKEIMDKEFAEIPEWKDL